MLEELANRRAEWLAELAMEFERRLKPEFRDSPMWQAAIRYVVSLVGNGLDYAVDAQFGLTDDTYLNTAIHLAAEINHIDDSSDESFVMALWGIVGVWYARGVAEILDELTSVDDRADVLSILLLNWGAFYSRLDLDTRGEHAAR